MTDANVASVIPSTSQGGTKNPSIGSGNIPIGPTDIPVGPGKIPIGPANVPVDPVIVPVGPADTPVSLKTNFILSAADSGVPITVTYTPSGQEASTNPLIIKADTKTALTVSLQFNVGGQNNAAKLLPNQQLYVNANVANNQNIPQNLVLVVVLYGPDGAMESYSVTPGNIEAQGAAQMDTSDAKLTLPADVSGYTAKAFIWNGTDIKSSSLIPLCNPVQITD